MSTGKGGHDVYSKWVRVFTLEDGVEGTTVILIENALGKDVKKAVLSHLKRKRGIAHVSWSASTITGGTTSKEYCEAFNAPGWKVKRMGGPGLETAITVKDSHGTERSVLLSEKCWRSEIERFMDAVRMGSWDYYEKFHGAVKHLNGGHGMYGIIHAVDHANNITRNGGKDSRRLVVQILDEVQVKLSDMHARANQAKNAS